MEKVYLDQNVVGDIVEGKININNTEFQFLISETIFDEIPVNESDRFLEALERSGVKLLIIGPDINPLLTDKAGIAYGLTLKQLYTKYISKQKYSKNIRALHKIIVRLLGTKHNNNPESLLQQYSNFVKSFEDSEYLIILESLKPLIEKLNSEIENNFIILEAAELTRKRINTDKGKINNIKGTKIIERIIEYLNINCKYDFSIFSNLKKSKDTKYSKIILLNAFLNIVGYHPDKHLNIIEHVPNVQNDGEHIANAMFCEYLLTHDRRMANRAIAIYEFLELNTEVILI